MNTKTKYLIPAFAAIFALMFVAVTPYVLADGMNGAKWAGGHHRMGHHAVLVEDFNGTIVIPQEITKETHDSIKSQKSVSLFQAVSVAETNGFTDAMKAKLGIVYDAEDNKYLAWILSNVERNADLNTKTKNIFVVDAGNPENFATMSKTYDHFMKNKMYRDTVAIEPIKDQA